MYVALYVCLEVFSGNLVSLPMREVCMHACLHQWGVLWKSGEFADASSVCKPAWIMLCLLAGWCTMLGRPCSIMQHAVQKDSLQHSSDTPATRTCRS